MDDVVHSLLLDVISTQPNKSKERKEKQKNEKVKEQRQIVYDSVGVSTTSHHMTDATPTSIHYYRLVDRTANSASPCEHNKQTNKQRLKFGSGNKIK